ncbi:MAG: tetrahydromethanopterin S-methyltransferase subunit A [Spirochaetales bacterium]|nr:tetrahydromethanopterin S-methyltransferase subunit A [Spirochaetales bacterium]
MGKKSIQKIKPHPDYPPEKGRYLRGNDFSPVAIAVILNKDEDKIPGEIQDLVRAGVESGAALSGTVQTPNIGFEKMICNLIANPNIRYLVLTGPESDGHMTGDALKALFKNGINKEKYIIGTIAKYPVLYNIPVEYIHRLLKQVTLIDLQFRGTPGSVKKVVWSCIQENPCEFEGYTLYDPGAYSEPPLSGKISDRIDQPWLIPDNQQERDAVTKMKKLVDKLKNLKKK